MSNPSPLSSRPVRPVSLVVAFWLLMSSAVLTVAGAAISIASVYSAEGEARLRASLEAAPDALAGEIDIDTLVGISQITSIAIQALICVVSLAIVLWIAFALHNGRRYIRVVATILAALQVFGVIASPTPLTIVSLVIVVGAVVLTWLPASNRYFIERTAIRRGRLVASAGR